MKKFILSFLLLTVGITYAQRNTVKKIIGTWVGPSCERYDSIKSKNIIYQDTLIFYKNFKYTWTFENQIGTWQIIADSNQKNMDELRLSAYDISLKLEQFKIGEEKHPFRIFKLTRKQLILKNYISWRDMDYIRNFECIFTKI